MALCDNCHDGDHRHHSCVLGRCTNDAGLTEVMDECDCPWRETDDPQEDNA